MLKKMFKVTVASLCLVLLLAVMGCSSAPTLDGSSKEAMEASLQEVTETLTEENKARFGAAIFLIGMENAVSGKDEADLLASLDGLTAEEVIARAEALVAGKEAEK